MPPKLEEGSETERVQIVAPATWVRRVEEWRRDQPRIPSRSEAIRFLVDVALGRTPANSAARTSAERGENDVAS